jgi:pyrimidine-nucleoside phosphorylase
MRIVDIIRRKRDGHEVTAEEITHIVSAYTRGELPDYQIASLLMAIVLRGMSRSELATLTESMLHSGEVLNFSDLPAPKVDKHSTGGVGDKTSLVIAPVAAAAGLYVPMISGRGLGHSGGTLDKLESIPGFNVNLSIAGFRRVLEKCGCALIGQTPEIAPADKKLYALRDVTGTVESPYLICASIMSKKLAEGIDALVLDVKTGSGAFMKDLKDSIHLAELMVETGTRMGKRVVALITDMDQPLGRAVGNSLEVAECIAILRGELNSGDLYDVCIELAAWMLYLGNRTPDVAKGRQRAKELIEGGAALEKFREIIALQGGDPQVCDKVARLRHAEKQLEITSKKAGCIASIECESVGTAAVVIGGGREKKEDSIDPAVGIVVHKKVGDAVQSGEPLCTLHYNSETRLQEARLLLERAWQITPTPSSATRPLIHKVISA